MTELPTLDQILEAEKNGVETDDEIKHIPELVNKEKLNCPRYSSGFGEINRALKGGFKDGDLIVISGVSGQGKTSIAQTLTYNLCKNGISCLWFSYEVSIEHLHSKFIDMEIDKFYHAFAPKKNTTGQLDWIKIKIKEAWAKFAVKAVFIDHIDFLTPTSVKTGDNETIALKRIATELKSLAIELNVVIVLMAHLKKIPDNKEPEMQDIGYSAGIFQLADCVFMIFREKNKDKNSNSIYTDNSILKLVKNRETGSTIWIKLKYFNSKFNEITNEYGEGNFMPDNQRSNKYWDI